MPKKILLFIALFVLLLNSVSCKTSGANQNNEPYSNTNLMLGTVITIKIYDKDKQNDAANIVKEAFDKIKEIEDKMSINIESSEVIEINNLAGKDYHSVSDETFYVIEKGKYFSNLSSGRFDITIGPLVKLWGIGTESAHVPSDKEINNALSLVNYKNISLDRENNSIKLEKEGMILDLGSIAKGFAADEIADLLEKHKIKSAIINLGGNIFAYGTKPDGNPWSIGINDPFSNRNKIAGSIKVINKTVVSSGVYERNFKQNGKQYHHILDTDTGYPVSNGLLGVSVISDKSIDADSLSTTIFSLGLEKGMELIESLKDTEALFITDESKIYLSSGIKDKFELLEDNFQIVN